MKKNKGITLISLIIYIIVSIIIIGMLTVITSHFRDNLNNMDVGTVQDTEFDKLNLQVLKETKTPNNSINEEETTTTNLVFSNGNIYTYVEADKTIYLNSNIKVAENISAFNIEISEVNGKKQLTVTITIEGKTRITQYIIET